MSPTLAKIATIISILLFLVMPVFAVDEGRSNPPEAIVWGFLGVCALIIVAQVAPMIRIFKKQSKMAAEQTKAVKVEELH